MPKRVSRIFSKTIIVLVLLIRDGRSQCSDPEGLLYGNNEFLYPKEIEGNSAVIELEYDDEWAYPPDLEYLVSVRRH